ncbi:hypothetical protein D3C78_1647940 [compost metagenome]
MRVAGNMLILLYNALFAIDQNKHHICSFNRFHRTHDTVFLRRFIHLATLAHAGSVDENITLSVSFEWRIDRITRSAGDVADDDAILSQQCIDKR